MPTLNQVRSIQGTFQLVQCQDCKVSFCRFIESRGEFLPDAPRSGYYPAPGQDQEETDTGCMDVIKVEDELREPDPGDNTVQHEAELLEEACSASSDGSESLEGSDSEEEVQEQRPKCYKHCAVGPLADKFVAHKTSRLVHYVDMSVSGGAGLRLISCGRALNQNYRSIERFDSVDMCRRCRTNAVKDGVLPKPAA